MKAALTKKNVEEPVAAAIIYSGFVCGAVMLAFWGGTLFHFASEHGKGYLWGALPAMVAEAYASVVAWVALSVALGGVGFVSAVGKKRLMNTFSLFTGLLCFAAMGVPGIFLAAIICGAIYFTNFITNLQ